MPGHRYSNRTLDRRTQRNRLYPRSLQLLRILAAEGNVILRDEKDGKYRVNGQQDRQSTVIERTLQPLLRTDAVRSTADQTDAITITDRGRRLVRRYDAHMVDTRARRVISYLSYENADSEEFGDVGTWHPVPHPTPHARYFQAPPDCG